MKSNLKFYILWAFIAFIIAVVAYKFVVGPEGVVEYLHIKHEKVEMRKSIKQIKEENHKLKKEIKELQISPKAREKILREKLKYIKNGEIHYHFVKGKGE